RGTIADDVGVESWWVEHNNTGAFANTSAFAAGGSGTYSFTYSLTLNSTPGVVVLWRVWARDVAGNLNCSQWERITTLPPLIAVFRVVPFLWRAEVNLTATLPVNLSMTLLRGTNPVWTYADPSLLTTRKLVLANLTRNTSYTLRVKLCTPAACAAAEKNFTTRSRLRLWLRHNLTTPEGSPLHYRLRLMQPNGTPIGSSPAPERLSFEVGDRVNLLIELNSSSILFRGLRLDYNHSLFAVVSRPVVSLPGRRYIDSVASNLSLEAEGVEIRFTLPGGSGSGQLKAYRCGDWNFTSSECASSWNPVGFSVQGGYVSVNTTGFSAYLLTRAEAAAPPPPPPAGGGGAPAGAAEAATGNGASATTEPEDLTLTEGGAVEAAPEAALEESKAELPEEVEVESVAVEEEQKAGPPPLAPAKEPEEGYARLLAAAAVLLALLSGVAAWLGTPRGGR
ncbi:MAG: hypothetical protein GXO66_01870, partial [Euryarchaeota archaeon]|nr:hypothetical protein [Euryarchaeota archaeon]